MELPTIRTLTFGLGDPHPLPAARLADAAERLRVAEKAYCDAAYEVQTVRITTRPVFDDVADDLVGYARRLQSQLDDLGIGHFSLGPAQAARPDFAVERIERIADVIAETSAVNCTVQLATTDHGVRADAALPTARCVLRIAESTPGGVGNFRFAALACVQPGHPFLPAGYHDGPDALTVGLQGAPAVAAALSKADPSTVTDAVRAAVVASAAPVVRIAQSLPGIRFGGIDLSPAPSTEAGIGVGLDRAVPGGFGAPGTIAVVAAITAALRSTDLPTCGYNGLMLPVLEDTVLARAWERGALSAHQLLAYSAICGTGLDTVPLPGDTSAEEIAGLLLDVATLATRLSKPLSARLFPVPGKTSGDLTEFGSPYLVDIRLP